MNTKNLLCALLLTSTYAFPITFKITKPTQELNQTKTNNVIEFNLNENLDLYRVEPDQETNATLQEIQEFAKQNPVTLAFCKFLCKDLDVTRFTIDKLTTQQAFECTVNQDNTYHVFLPIEAIEHLESGDLMYAKAIACSTHRAYLLHKAIICIKQLDKEGTELVKTLKGLGMRFIVGAAALCITYAITKK